MSLDLRAAEQLAEEIRKSSDHFLTITKKELSDRFGIQRMTEGLGNEIATALANLRIDIHPHPWQARNVVRLYDLDHPVGGLFLAVIEPDRMVDVPLRRYVNLVTREEDGRAGKTELVPWIEAFAMMLEALLGREPEGWEDMVLDRSHRALAATLADALGLDEDGDPLVQQQRQRLAGLAGRWRPIGRKYAAEEIVARPNEIPIGEAVIQAVAEIDRVIRRHRTEVVNAIAKLVLGGDPPKTEIDVARVGLRRRREDFI
jgi:hypothetical protein